MGFLTFGSPLNWDEMVSVTPAIKQDGISQLLHLWAANQGRHDHDLKWGDEIEMYLVHLDEKTKRARLWSGADKILPVLIAKESSDEWNPSSATSRELGECAASLSGASKRYLLKSEWHPEFSNTVIETTPNPPYDLSLDSFCDVEDSMISRRYKIQSVLPPGVFACTLASFPRLGLEDFMIVPKDDCVDADQVVADSDDLSNGSQFIPGQFITKHPRFPTLVKSILRRRQATPMDIRVPVFNDIYTRESSMWADSLPASEASSNAALVAENAKKTANPVRGQIWMDHFGFGMGQNCLQATFLAPTIGQARFLYDQFSVLSPLFLCLSAATPILRGLLSGLDTRWTVLEQGCDCRTEAEKKTLHKSRYASTSLYISDDPMFLEKEKELNDVPVNYDQAVFARLVAAGMDATLAKHFAWLWTRDPMVIFGDRINIDNTTESDHFENIQSTNWHSVRFKVPPPAPEGSRSPIGWRVEFRTPDIQLTDFENAGLACLISLLAMAIMRKNWNFYIPMSKNDENFAACHQMGAVTEGKFWFRHNVNCNSTSDEFSQMTLREIFLGSRRTRFQGLLPMLDQFVSEEWRAQKCSPSAVEKYRRYADLVRKRVLGEVPTDAAFVRQLARSHPDYQGDSAVSPIINFEISKVAVSRGFLGTVPSGLLAPVRCYCPRGADLVSCVRGLSRLHLAEVIRCLGLNPIARSVDGLPSALPSPQKCATAKLGVEDRRRHRAEDDSAFDSAFDSPLPTPESVGLGSQSVQTPDTRWSETSEEQLMMVNKQLSDARGPGVHLTCRCPLTSLSAQTFPVIQPFFEDEQAENSSSADW